MTTTVNAAYLRIRPMRPGQVVHRTVEVIGETLLVDLDERGAVLGIERIGGPVDLDSLGAVIRWLRAPTEAKP